MSNNRTWLAFANRKRCRHADAIHSLGFISWRMGRARFSIGDVVYLFMSDERCIRFKMVVTAENCKREDQEFWVETPPNDITYKLELLEEYEGTMLSEQEYPNMDSMEADLLKFPVATIKNLLDTLNQYSNYERLCILHNKLLYSQQQISTVWLQFIAIVNTKMKS